MRGPLAGVLGSIVTIVGALIIMLARPHLAVVAVLPEAHTADYQTALFEASKAYGHAGCGDQKLAEMTAKYAIKSGLSAGFLASHIAVESTCNPMAVSNRNAIGLMQVVPKVWSKRFDFTKINLFNPEDNMMVGTTIMSELVTKYGIHQALVRYYGTGKDDVGMGGVGYAMKVLTLTGAHQ
jgi:soluble lytic murein transglycosylase-like protein